MTTADTRTDTIGGWWREIVAAVLLVVVMLAGIEGAAFATWASFPSTEWLLVVVLIGMAAVVSVIPISATLSGSSEDGRRGQVVELRWTWLIAAVICTTGIVGNGVLIPAIIQAEFAVHPGSGPSTLASLDGQRALLLNGFSVRLYLVLAAGFIGLLVLRRRSA